MEILIYCLIQISGWLLGIAYDFKALRLQVCVRAIHRCHGTQWIPSDTTQFIRRSKNSFFCGHFLEFLELRNCFYFDLFVINCWSWGILDQVLYQVFRRIVATFWFESFWSLVERCTWRVFTEDRNDSNESNSLRERISLTSNCFVNMTHDMLHSWFIYAASPHLPNRIPFRGSSCEILLGRFF